MEQPFPESSESKDDSEMPIGSIETDGEAEDVAREDREIQWNRSARNPLNRRREQKWNERCEPGLLPCLSLPSAALGFVGGLGCAVLLGVFARSLDNRSSAALDELPPPCPQDVAMANEESSDTEDLGFMTSEAGMDQHAQEEAEKIRFETEQRLAQTDEIMIWCLDDWRQPLATFQDMMVQLAGVGTGGGTWVGHAMQRNDLTLEADLLEPHAEALAANPSGEPAPAPIDLEATRQRAKDWQALWTEFESTAEKLRNSPEIDDIWKRHLDSTLREARKAHGALSDMLGDMKDDAAAQAVVDFCADDFSEARDMFQHDDPEPGH